ncbi:MAG: hypothetical protein KC933_32340 [Myxococcales bacterium]|nr:hypothetical protein [Myxococcales bacterium]
MTSDDTSAPRPSALDIVRRFADQGGDLVALHRIARARAEGATQLSGPGTALALVWGQGNDVRGLRLLADAARIEARFQADEQVVAACDAPL